jgi:hypothetical protein
MLDDCKGERLEEVLAVFSNAVLKKVLHDAGSGEHAALAQQLALENFSYHGERSVLSALIVAHKASLSKHLQNKQEAKARYHDFSNLLDLNDCRIVRRHEQLKQAITENDSQQQISDQEVSVIQNQVRNSWSGNSEWLESILFSDNRSHGEGILSSRFEKVWKHVERGTISEVEGQSRIGLLEQLDARVKSQESRLARWQDFGRTLAKPGELSPSKKPETKSSDGGKIDLGFNLHQTIQIGRKECEEPIQSTAVSLEEYNRLIENMRSELATVGKPQERQKVPRHSLPYNNLTSFAAPDVSSQPQEVSTNQDEGWSSANDTDEISPVSTSFTAKSTPQTPPSSSRTLRRGRQKLPDRCTGKEAPDGDEPRVPPVPLFTSRPYDKPKESSPPAQRPEARSPPLVEQPNLETNGSESDLADAILNSVSAASPSPKKTRHTLSLAERTRLSMSRASHSQLSDLHDDFEIEELPRLSIRPRPSFVPKIQSSESEPGKHEDLVERTRRSMANMEAVQKKVQLERRRSVKEEKKKVRQTSYFPKVEEKEASAPDISAIELMQGDPDYESVFKSRPKIKTSPAVSPTRIWEESETED